MTETVYQTTVTDPVDREERKLAREIIEAIERPLKGTRENLGEAPGGGLPPLPISGFGDPYEDCGDDLPHFCTDCGRPFTIPRTCRRSTCPRCAPAWVVDRSTTIVGKIDAAARMMSADLGGQPVYKHHVIFSPPDDWFLRARDPLEKTIDVIKEIFDLMNAEGALFYHSWSGADDHEDDRGQWKKRLYSGRDWEGDVRSELKPRGHFHAVVASPFIPGGDVTRMVHEATDWIIHRVNKRDGSGHSLTDLSDVARAVTYALSHTGIQNTEKTTKNNQAVYRYVGSRINSAEVFDDIEREASMAVREAAPRTLGISAQQVRCGRQIEIGAPGDAMASSADLWDYSDGDRPEGDSCEPEHSPVTDDGEEDGFDPTETHRCTGEIEPITKADDYLNDPEWVAQAAKADDLQTTWDEWSGKSWPPGD